MPPSQGQPSTVHPRPLSAPFGRSVQLVMSRSGPPDTLNPNNRRYPLRGKRRISRQVKQDPKIASGSHNPHFETFTRCPPKPGHTNSGPPIAPYRIALMGTKPHGAIPGRLKPYPA
ncbi:hypothetical protein LQZ19_11335, partial [Treponema primitia]|uniref:hypothetical protein n=1 Tax=Treponema primitia TaxID=88058 RepID=UPI00397F2B2D